MITKNKGFTLVELMIALAMSGIIIAAVYSVYSVQQRAYGKQNQVMDIQQNLRAILYIISQEIRMAGFSFTPGNRGFSNANATSMTFSFDRRKKKKNSYKYKEKKVTYSFSEAKLKFKTGTQTLANNIEKIEFYYTLKNGNKKLAPTSVKDIRAVTISILGRSEKQDNTFKDTNIYKSASGANWSPTTEKDKHYRRQLFITTIQCRNMGL